MILEIENVEGNIQCISCDYVLDINDEGDIIGVEFIDYYGFLQGVNIKKIKEKYINSFFESVALDLDSGAIYIKLKNQKSYDQKVVKGTICKNIDGDIVLISLTFSAVGTISAVGPISEA